MFWAVDTPVLGHWLLQIDEVVRRIRKAHVACASSVPCTLFRGFYYYVTYINLNKTQVFHKFRVKYGLTHTKNSTGFKVSLWRDKRRRILKKICFTRFLKNNVIIHSSPWGGFICPFCRFDAFLEVSPVGLGKVASCEVSFKAVFLTRMGCRAGLVPSQTKFVWSFRSETHNKNKTLQLQYFWMRLQNCHFLQQRTTLKFI